MTGQSFWSRADSKCSAGWFDSISPRESLSNHCLEHSDARSSGDISTMLFEWFWVMCVVIHLIKPVSGLTDWKPRKSTCVVFHSIWPLFGLTDYQPHCIRYEHNAMCNWTGQRKGKGQVQISFQFGQTNILWYFQIFSDYPRLLHPTAHCTQILDRCTSLVHTLVTFLSSYTLCDWSIFLKPCW